MLWIRERDLFDHAVAEVSLGSDFRLRCAAHHGPLELRYQLLTQEWRGAASSVVGRSFSDLPSLALFDMRFRSPKPLA